MVDSLIVAALAVSSTAPAKAILTVPQPLPTSLKSGDHVSMQTERRRVARAAVNSANTLSDLAPLLKRAQADDAIVSTKGLLDRTDRQIKDGRQEEAMLTIDMAAVSLERAKVLLPSDVRINDLDMKERELRRALGQPSLPVGKHGDVKGTPTPAATPDRTVLKDELPVG